MLTVEQTKSLATYFEGKDDSPYNYQEVAARYGLSLTPAEEVSEAYQTIPRANFVHPEFRDFAATNLALPIWHSPATGARARELLAALEKGETRGLDDYFLGIGKEGINTSQPLLILVKLALANLTESSKVAEIGSGCGYLCALAASIAGLGEVQGFEKIPALVRFSRIALQDYVPAKIQERDILKGGLPDEGYDAIISSAAATKDVALKIAERLNPNGRLVVPIREPGAHGLNDLAKLRVYIRKESGAALHPANDFDVSYTLLK